MSRVFYKRSQSLHSGTNLGLTGGKYLIKIVFGIKIENSILEISNVPNFNKF